MRKGYLFDEKIYWIGKENYQTSVGLLGFEEVPRFLGDILELSLEDENNRLVFSPTKLASWKLLESSRQSTGMDQWKDYHPELEKSRYSIIGKPTSDLRYFIINCSAIPTNLVKITVLFIEKSVAFQIACKDFDTSKFTEMMAETLFAYMKNIGIPFINPDEDSLKFGKEFPRALPRFYAELQASKYLLEYNMGEASDMILQKLEILFSTIQSAPVLPLNAVYEYLSQFTQAVILVSLACKYEPIRPTFLDKFDKEFSKLIVRLKDYPDLVKAFRAIRSHIQTADTDQSFEKFVDAITGAFKQAFEIVGSRYVRLSEMEPLTVAVQTYEQLILSNKFPYLEKLGTANDFISSFSKMMDKESNPIEMRVLAGELALRVMTAKMLTNGTTQTIDEGKNLVIRFADLIDSRLDELHQRFGKWDTEEFSLDYEEATTILYAYSQIALVNGEIETQRVLEEKAFEIAQRRELTSQLLIFAWKNYLTSQAPVHLRTIDRLAQKPNWNFSRETEPFVKLILIIAESFFEGRSDRFAAAKDAAIEIASTHSTSGLNPQVIRSSAAYSHIVQVFEQIFFATRALTIEESRVYLRRASNYAQLMKENLAVQDVMMHIARRTQALYALSQSDYYKAQKICEQDDQSLPPNVESKFNQVLEAWCRGLPFHQGRSFSSVSMLDFKDEEPWSQLLKKEMLRTMRFDLERHIVGCRALVFTEGIYDDLILERITSTLEPRKQVTYLNVGGYANIPYFAEAKVTGALKLPVYLLFDGDVPKDSRTSEKYLDIRRSLSLPDDHVKVLAERSIEAYLLVPSALLRSFPECKRSIQDIVEFVTASRNKQSKKQVLESLLSFCGLPRYSKEIAGKIASNLLEEEIGADLKMFIREFCSDR